MKSRHAEGQGISTGPDYPTVNIKLIEDNQSPIRAIEAGRIRPSDAALLDRIARVLKLPIDAFYDRGEGLAASQGQVADHVAAFVAIEDPAARQRCLAFVRSASGRPPSDGAVG